MIEKHLIKHEEIEVDKQGGYLDYSVYKEDNVFIFEVWDVQKVSEKSSQGKWKMYKECENEQDAIQVYELWKKEWA